MHCRGEMQRVGSFLVPSFPRYAMPYEESALQAVCFLQGLYGFVIRDFNYEAMQAYRDLARSAIVLAVSICRSSCPRSSSAGSVDPAGSPEYCEVLCNQLISNVCNM